jgi:hypothetical protein
MKIYLATDASVNNQKEVLNKSLYIYRLISYFFLKKIKMVDLKEYIKD